MTEQCDIDELLGRLQSSGSSAAGELREQLCRLQLARATQPERLSKARQEAEEARQWAQIEEPWKAQCAEVSSVDGSMSLTVPNWIGKEVFGARLAFDILDCGDDIDRQNSVLSSYFAMVDGDPTQAMMLWWSALTTIATTVVPMMLDEIETHASNYEARILLAQARTKAWSERVGPLRAECHANTGSDTEDEL